MSVLRRVLPLVCCALMALVAANTFGESPKKPSKKKQPAQTTKQTLPCGKDGDGNPIPPENCAPPSPPAVQQPASMASGSAASGGTAAGGAKASGAKAGGAAGGSATAGAGTAGSATASGTTASGTAASGTAAAGDTSVGCAVSPPGANGSIEMTAVGGEATYSLSNPLKGAKSIKASWLPKQALLTVPNATAPAQPISESKPFPFTLGFCGPDPKDPKKPLSQYFVFTDDLSALASAETIIIRFVPNEVGSFERYLELQYNNATDQQGTKPAIKRYDVIGNAGAPDYANDARYKIWAYTGFTFLRSQNDFSDSFAELLLRVETRWTDARIAMK